MASAPPSATATPTATPAASTVAETASPEPIGAPWLALQVFTGQRFELRVIDEAGNRVSAPGADVKGRNQTNPDWSPDGSMLTFVMTGADDRDDLW